MSNTICVIVKGRKSYYSCKWVEYNAQFILHAYINKKWQEVMDTGKRTLYNEKIFSVVSVTK